MEARLSWWIEFSHTHAGSLVPEMRETRAKLEVFLCTNILVLLEDPKSNQTFTFFSCLIILLRPQLFSWLFLAHKSRTCLNSEYTTIESAGWSFFHWEREGWFSSSLCYGVFFCAYDLQAVQVMIWQTNELTMHLAIKNVSAFIVNDMLPCLYTSRNPISIYVAISNHFLSKCFVKSTEINNPSDKLQNS